MSKRKHTYTKAEMIEELMKMDAQIIDGSDIFKQAAQMVQESDAKEIYRVAPVLRTGKDIAGE